MGCSPLEATAIGCILKQVESISYWPLRSFAKLEKRERLTEKEIEIFNQHFLNYICKMSVFVGWHYVMGSPFNTNFWKFAKSNFYRETEKLENKKLLEDFNKILKLGEKLPHSIKRFQEFSAITSDTNKNVSTLLRQGISLTFAGGN